MADATFTPPTFDVVSGSRVQLHGNWALIAHGNARKRLRRELAKLESPLSMGWDLREIETFDSGGALLLWDIWGGRFPGDLQCKAVQRRWFEHLDATPDPPRPPTPPVLLQPLLTLGQILTTAGQAAWGMMVLAGRLALDFVNCLTHPRIIPWTELSGTIYRAGASSMLLLGVVGFLMGVVMALQVGIALSQFGTSDVIIGLLGLAILRELGAVITAIILAGRSGAAITASIATMHVTEEYNALRSFGVSPTLRLVLPRVVGLGISLPLLVLWTDFWALIGSSVSVQSKFEVPQALFFSRLPDLVPVVNFWIGLGKAALFGLTIALVASHFGLNSAPNSASVSHNTTTSVVTSLILIILMDAALGAAMTGIGLQ